MRCAYARSPTRWVLLKRGLSLQERSLCAMDVEKGCYARTPIACEKTRADGGQLLDFKTL